MGSPNFWPSGLGGTGPDLATENDDAFSGIVYWVDTVNGNNANTGVERELPLLTLAQAHTNASAGDLIVIEAGSAETLTGSQALNKADVYIIGLGSGSNRPRYTCGGAVSMFAASAAGVKIFNLYFPASTAVPTARVNCTAAEIELNGCYFECGTNDTNPTVIVGAGANSARVEDCSFVVTASRPSVGLSVTSTVTDLKVIGTTFDGGSYGWSDYAWKVSAAATRIYANNVTLAHRADIGFTATGTSYKFFGINVTGTGRVVLTA